MIARAASVSGFRLTTVHPERLARFYAGLGFAVGKVEAIGNDEMRLLNLARGGIRVPLRLGEQRLDLDCFDVKGRPYPPEATAADLCFQHLALVTGDAAEAWTRVLALGAVPISIGGPVKLPPATRVAAAAKFRDPEGHPLELLQFPPQSTRMRGAALLGIDHSAISVAIAGLSRRFYETLGLAVRGPTLNGGPTQAALDGLGDVEVDVIPMVPCRATPHLELLGYRKPAGRPAQQPQANDIAATRTVWAADRDALIRDPDGHLHLLRRAQSGSATVQAAGEDPMEAT